MGRLSWPDYMRQRDALYEDDLEVDMDAIEAAGGEALEMFRAGKMVRKKL